MRGKNSVWPSFFYSLMHRYRSDPTAFPLSELLLSVFHTHTIFPSVLTPMAHGPETSSNWRGGAVRGATTHSFLSPLHLVPIAVHSTLLYSAVFGLSCTSVLSVSGERYPSVTSFFFTKPSSSLLAVVPPPFFFSRAPVVPFFSHLSTQCPLPSALLCPFYFYFSNTR